MPEYTTISLDKKFKKEMEKRLEQFPEYGSLKEFMKQAAIEKLQELEKEKRLREKQD